MLRRVVCIISTLLCALLVAGAPRIAANLPAPPRNMAARPYAGWSGVVRVWVYQGFRSGTGSVVPWLNACLTAFERRNPGVYVHVETVSASALERLCDADPRPDMIVFSPGAAVDGALLLPVAQPEGLMPELTDACGALAVPLCWGGYGLLTNTADLPEPPDDWSAALAAQYRAGTKRRAAHYALQAPSGGAWARVTRELLGGIPDEGELLPADFMECSLIKAWSDFKKGNVAAIPASQWHIRQLALLEAEGKAPGWAFAPLETGYSDMYFAAAPVDTGLADADSRADAARRAIAHLAGEESQAALDRALLIPAREGVRIYAGGAMEQIVNAYEKTADFEPLFAP